VVNEAGSQFIQAEGFFDVTQLLCLVCSSLVHTAKKLSDSFVEICEIHHRLIIQEHVNNLYKMAYVRATYGQNVLRLLLFRSNDRFNIK
jgi:hypothetical protein